MYEELTAFLPRLQNTSFGVWDIDRENDGTAAHPIRFPSVDYSPVVWDFIKTAYRFLNQHKEMEFTNYHEILRANFKSENYVDVDVSSADGRAVMALIIGAIRAERFCDGALLGCLEGGSITRWLLRLKEIDKEVSA